MVYALCAFLMFTSSSNCPRHTLFLGKIMPWTFWLISKNKRDRNNNDDVYGENLVYTFQDKWKWVHKNVHKKRKFKICIVYSLNINLLKSVTKEENNPKFCVVRFIFIFFIYLFLNQNRFKVRWKQHVAFKLWYLNLR